MAVALLLLAAFYLLPWLRWNGRPAVLLDLSARRFDLFELTLWPEDALLVLLASLFSATALALATTLWGRIWCGYGCPQTLLTRIFRSIERGTNFRGGGLLRHALWAAISLWTGITFVGFFSPLQELFDTTWNSWHFFWAAFYALATWINVVHLREQLCHQLCPYARLQRALGDRDTPRVVYDARRAEPRGARDMGNGSVMQRARGLLDPVTANDYVFRAAHPAIAGARPHFNAEHLGDCTDCWECVRVCPVNLDIRNGSDHRCIECRTCIDSCDTEMKRFHFPNGLIRLASVNRTKQSPTGHLRPKVLALAAAASTLLLGTLLVALT